MAGKKKPGEVIASIKFNGNLRTVVLGRNGGHITSGVNVPHEPNFDPNDVWWDIENSAIPKDVEAKDMHNLIVQGLRKRNYQGPVNIRMVFAKTNDHITLDSLAQMQAIEQRDMGIYSVIPEKDAADKAILAEIKEHAADPLKQPPRNIFVLSGDTFFVDTFEELQEKDYRLLGCFRPGTCKENLLNGVVIDSWLYRDLLDLPYMETKRNKAKKRGRSSENEHFVQHYYEGTANTTLPFLIHFLRQNMESKVIVHFFTCSTVEFIARVLREMAVPCMEIHGNKPLEANIREYEEFKAAEKGIVLCSDGVGLGPHIASVNWIVRYDFPDSPDLYFRKVLRPALGSGAQAIMIVNHEQKDFLKLFQQQDLVLQRMNIPEAELFESRSLVEKHVSKNETMKNKSTEAYAAYLEFVQHRLEKKKLNHQAERQAVTAASFGIE